MNFLSQLDRSYLQNKTCLLRVNLDTDPNPDALRINAIIPTIKFLLDNNVKIIILSHRGRPKGKDLSLSLKPLVDILSQKIGQPLQWLENLRFDPREKENSDELAKELAAKGDFFVNDDFAVSHRSNASVVAITKYLPSFAGLLLEKEVEILSQVKNNPKKPLVVIIGGIKIDDKMEVINNLKEQADYFLMGSAYIKNQKSKIKNQNFGETIFAEDFSDSKKFDIGPKTIERYRRIISSAKTIIWNGPLGKFENEKYINGSREVALAIVSASRQIGAFSVAGGGDTNQLLCRLNLQDKFDFISTGGGSMLSFLAGKELPGIKALNLKQHNNFTC